MVFIIGILAAVAIPQYEKAVEKSRAAEALVKLKSLREAQELYYMANGRYATSFAELNEEEPNDGNFGYWIGTMSKGATTSQ